MKINHPQEEVGITKIRIHGQGTTNLSDRFFVSKATGRSPEHARLSQMGGRKFGIELQGFAHCFLGLDLPLFRAALQPVSFAAVGKRQVRPSCGKGVIQGNGLL